VFDELVRPADLKDGGGDALLVEQLQHRTAEAAHEDVVFEGDDHLGGAAKELEHAGVQGFDKSRVDEGDVVAFRQELVGGLAAQGHHVAQGEQGHLVSAVVGEAAQDFGFADFDEPRLVLDGHPDGRAARIADEGRMRLVGSGKHHVHQFILVLGRHEDAVGHVTQVGDVKQTVMSGPVLGGEPGAVHAEHHRQVLQRGVMNHTVVGALEEGGVDGANGMKPHGSQATGEQDRVLFGDAHVVIPVGHGGFEQLQAGAAGHGRGNPNQRGILLAQTHHGLAENILPIGRGARLHRRRGAGMHVVGSQAVEFLRVPLGGFEAFALLGEDVNDDGMVAGFGEFEGLNQQRQVVAVYGPQVAQPHLLENQAAAIATAALGSLRDIRRQADFGQRALEPLLGFVGQLEGDLALGQPAQKPLEVARQLVVRGVRDELVEVGGDRPHIFGDAPFVVVQDADEPFGGMGNVVERFERNPVCQGGVAEDGHHVLVPSAAVPSGANAQGRRERGARVRGAIAIVFALGAEREAADAAGGAQGVEPVLPSGQNLVDVGLVADIPDKFVFGGVKDVMQCQGQFHHAQVGPQMAAVAGQHRDQLLPDFLRQDLQLVHGQLLDVNRTVHHLKILTHGMLRLLRAAPPRAAAA